MPELLKKPNSPYWYIDYFADGKRHRISTKTTNKKVAEAQLHAIADKINKDELFLPQKITATQFIEKYLIYSQNHKAHDTYKMETYVIDRFFKDKKDIFLKKINPMHIEEYVNGRINAGVKNTTANSDITILKVIFNQAIKWEYLNKNPVDSIKKLPNITKKFPRFLSVDEIDSVLAECSPWLYNIVVTLILTGMRIGELVNLTWNDINFERHRIHIQSKDNWTPKAYQIRAIPIFPAVLDVLKRLPKNTKYVFMSSEKCKINKRNLQRRQFGKITKKLKLKDVTIHTLRHTFASHLAMKGVDLRTISQLLGHSNTKTTEIYSHIAQSHLDGAINQFASLPAAFNRNSRVTIDNQ
ncbi:MAG: tyrosine-type recombinase/integrase [Caldisericia bacterium]